MKHPIPWVTPMAAWRFRRVMGVVGIPMSLRETAFRWACANAVTAGVRFYIWSKRRK